MIFALFAMYCVFGFCILRIQNIFWTNWSHKNGIKTFRDEVDETKEYDRQKYMKIYKSLKIAYHFSGKAGVALINAVEAGNIGAIILGIILLLTSVFVESFVLWPITFILIQYEQVSTLIKLKKKGG